MTIQSMTYKGERVDVTGGFHSTVTTWESLVAWASRWNAARYHAAHPETVKARGADQRARHKRRYQRMMARGRRGA